MIERLLFTLLVNGLAEIKANPELIDELFGPECFELEATEVEAIKQLLVEQPPRVAHGYPQADGDFPVYSITLGSESEAIHFLAHDGGLITEEGDDFGAEKQTTIWDHVYNIFVYTEHPDVTVYYYHLAKLMLLRDQNFFNDKGMDRIDISGGDMAPNTSFLPAHLFVRRLTFKAQREFTTLLRPDKAFKVAGIHAEAGTNSSIGNVKTLVTTSVPES